MTLEAIKTEIETLSVSELRELLDFVGEKFNAAWDAQIERDVKVGRLDFLIEEAEAEYKAGRVRPLFNEQGNLNKPVG